MKNVFFGSWSDLEGMIEGWCNYWWVNKDKGAVDPERAEIAKDLEGAEVLFAAYGGRGYEGSAFVLYRKDGKLYEVNGSHCSCNGLEGQWSPEETNLESLKLRQNHSPNDYRMGIINSDEYEQEAVNRFDELLKELEG